MKQLHLILFAAALVFSAACTKNNLDVPENFDNKYNVDLRIFKPLNVAPAEKDGWWRKDMTGCRFDNDGNIVETKLVGGSGYWGFFAVVYILTENGKIVEKVIVKEKWETSPQLKEKYLVQKQYSPAIPVSDLATRKLSSEFERTYLDEDTGDLAKFEAYVLLSEPERFIAVNFPITRGKYYLADIFSHVDYNPLEGKTKVDTMEEFYKED